MRGSQSLPIAGAPQRRLGSLEPTLLSAPRGHAGLFHHLRRATVVGLLALATLFAAPGCSDSDKKKKEVLPPLYPQLPPRKNLPEFMKGTVFEFTEVQNNEPYPVSGYGLVVGLTGAGDNLGLTPLAVRNHMIDEMVRHGFGGQDDRLKNYRPADMLRDPRVAIAEVFAFLPVGARAGQRTDAYVRAVEGSTTPSLARGNLYLTNLYVDGVDPIHPKGKVNVYAKVRGSIFVNPGYTSSVPSTQANAQASLRAGVIMNGAVVMADRPINLRLRTAQLSIARAIEMRIDQRYQNETVAKTQDEGIVQLLVPPDYKGDWEHFIGVINHMYLDPTPALVPIKAKQLIEEAQKPDAPLMDISYCWEAMGSAVAPFIQPLYTHSSPDIAFAAARAGAFVRDPAAEEAIADMAKHEGHPFQLNAAKTLAALPQSPRIDRMLSELLLVKNALVRIEAYQVLAEHDSPSIISTTVRDAFIIDRIPGQGSPLVYATRTGTPRIALFGNDLALKTPIVFRTLEDRLTITSTPGHANVVTIFDRTVDIKGKTAQSRTDVHELLYRLGGGSDDGFKFVYSELLGIIQALADGRHIPAAFVLQDLPALQDAIEGAPPLQPDGAPLDQTPNNFGGVEAPRLKSQPPAK